MCYQHDYLQQVSMTYWGGHTNTVFSCKQMQLRVYAVHREAPMHIFSACQISLSRWPNRKHKFHGSDWLITFCLYVFICLSLEIPTLPWGKMTVHWPVLRCHNAAGSLFCQFHSYGWEWVIVLKEHVTNFSQKPFSDLKYVTLVASSVC